MMRRTLVLTVIASLAAAPAPAAEPAPAVPLGMAVEFVDHAACAHIARKQGWFEQAGIQLRTYDTYLTGMALAAALARGDIDVAYICMIPAINAIVNGGLRFRIVAGTHRYGYGLMVDPAKVRTVADLERPDVRIGCPREGSPADVLVHRMIERYHLDRAKVLGKLRRMPPPKVLMAMKSGQLDAGFACEQFPTMAEELGFQVLLTARDLWPSMQGSVVIAREELIEERPEVVARIVSITRRATRFLHDHPRQASEIVAGALQATEQEVLPLRIGKLAARLRITPEVIRRSLQERMECDVQVDPAQVQETLDELSALGYLRRPAEARELLHLEFLE